MKSYNSLAEFNSAQRAMQVQYSPQAPPPVITAEIVAIIEAHAAGAPARKIAELETRLSEVRGKLESGNYGTIAHKLDLEKTAQKIETELSQLTTAGDPGKQE